MSVFVCNLLFHYCKFGNWVMGAVMPKRVCNIMDADKAYLILSNMILFTCSFNSVTLSLGYEGEPFGAHKQYAMTIGN